MKKLLYTLLAAVQFYATAQTVNVGNGSYTTSLPNGRTGPSVFESYFTNTPDLWPTNDWWQSLPFRFLEHNRYSEPMFPHPLIVKAEAFGLGIGDGSSSNIVNNNQFQAPYNPDLFIRVEGMNANETVCEDYTDWTVTAKWDDGDDLLYTTFGHGLPFVYAETRSGETARISFTGTNLSVVHNDGNALCINYNGKIYGLFASNSQNWSQAANDFLVNVGNNPYFSVALLPNSQRGTFDQYKACALNFVTNTTFSWEYNKDDGNVSGQFQMTTEDHGLNSTLPITALMPHQWKYTAGVNYLSSYNTLRGEMRTIQQNSFEVVYPVIPNLPYIQAPQLQDTEELRALFNEEYQIWQNIGLVREDTYWHGKELNKYIQLLSIADQLGETEKRNELVEALKDDLEGWFTASNGENSELFYYDPMGVLIGYPASFNTNTELNDMHFHYSYFIMAASVVARYDRAWATEWRDMVELLIRNCNSWDRNDDLFPFLRYFDPYEGHSWANGWALFGDGNNMESSSESVNFAAAMINWGHEMCDDQILDLGMYLYHSEIIAAEQYWFNIDEDNFPGDYPKDYSAILWGSGGVFGTFWTAQPEEVRGINILPVTGYSLYLGKDPDYVTRFYDNLKSEDTYDFWRYVHWSYIGLADADRGKGEYYAFKSQKDNTEYGSTEAFTHHWLNTHQQLGLVQHDITADIENFAVYEKDGQKTYVAYNSGCRNTQQVNFSDGFTMNLNSSEYKIEQPVVSAIVEDQSLQVSVYPNPVQSVIYISVNEEIIIGMSIRDVLGNELLSSSTNELNIEGLPSGTFIIQVRTTTGNYTSNLSKK